MRAGFCYSANPQPAGDVEVSAIAAQEPRLNEEIRTRECRLIGYDGSQMGIFNTREAMRIAEEAGLDLVEIAPNAEPRVPHHGLRKVQKLRPSDQGQAGSQEADQRSRSRK